MYWDFNGWACNPVPGPQDAQHRVAIIVTMITLGTVLPRSHGSLSAMLPHTWALGPWCLVWSTTWQPDKVLPGIFYLNGQTIIYCAYWMICSIRKVN